MLAHYLPRCYLDAFTLDKRLFVFDRDTGKLRRDSPQNVAAITDYYIVTNESGEREESIEHGLLAKEYGLVALACTREPTLHNLRCSLWASTSARSTPDLWRAIA
jgi:hypothetical protein